MPSLHFSLHDEALGCETRLNKLVNLFSQYLEYHRALLKVPSHGNAFTTTTPPPESSTDAAPAPVMVPGIKKSLNKINLLIPDSNSDSVSLLSTPNLSLIPRERRRSFLKLQTVATPKPEVDEATATSFFCFSPTSYRTQKGRKKLFLHSSGDQDDILTKKRFVADILFRLLSLNSKDKEMLHLYSQTLSPTSKSCLLKQMLVLLTRMSGTLASSLCSRDRSTRHMPELR